MSIENTSASAEAHGLQTPRVLRNLLQRLQSLYSDYFSCVIRRQLQYLRCHPIQGPLSGSAHLRSFLQTEVERY